MTQTETANRNNTKVPSIIELLPQLTKDRNKPAFLIIFWLPSYMGKHMSTICPQFMYMLLPYVADEVIRETQQLSKKALNLLAPSRPPLLSGAHMCRLTIKP